MSIETIKSELNELKWTFNNPKISIANYCDNLRNQIDLAFIKQEINLLRDIKATKEIRKKYALIIDQIRSFEEKCQNQLMNYKLGEKKSKDKIHEEIVQIEKSIDNYINTRDIEEDIINTQYNDIMQKIESC